MATSILLGAREPANPTRLAPGTGWLAWLHPKSPEELVREALASGALPPLPPTSPSPADPPAAVLPSVSTLPKEK